MIPRRYITTYKGFSLDLIKWIFHKKKKEKDFREHFQEKLSKYLNNDNLFLLNSGRSAIPLMLEAIGIKKDEEILVSAYNLRALMPILEEYCKVKYFDIDDKTYSLDIEKILENITNKTKAVILTHPFGFCTDVSKIKKELEKRNIILIEDCAHSLGSKYENKNLGCFGDFALFSFDYIKPLSTLGGGALIVNNKNYLDYISEKYNGFIEPDKKETQKKILKYYFQTISINTPLFFFVKLMLEFKPAQKLIYRLQQGTPKNNSNKMNKKLSQFQSMVGFKSLEKLDDKLKKTETLYNNFKDKLKIKYRENLQKGYNTKLSYYFLTYNTQKRSEEFRRILMLKGIDVGTYDEIMDLCDDKKEIAKTVYNSLIQIPLYPNLSVKKVEKIANEINRIEKTLKVSNN